jgi:gamma-glutamyltranspeptidase/glutathione hydrolase
MVVRLVDYRQNPQSCSDGPRWIVNADFSVCLEEQRFPPGLADELRKRGQRIVNPEVPMFGFGGAQLVYKLDDGYCAGSDHRKDGGAVGF